MEHNLQQCVQLVKEASAAGAKVLFLPEASDYIAENREQSLALARPESSSPFAAREHDVDVNVGIHVPAPAPASDETNQRRLLLNRTIHITGSSGGAIDARGTYDKLHLFDYGALRESAAGAALTPPFDTPRRPRRRPDVLRPALPRARPRAGPLGDPRPRRPGAGGPAQVLTYPSAFTCFVVAAAQVGVHHHGAGPGGRVSFGRSMAVDPWGRVLCALPGVGAGGEVPEAAAAPALGVFDVDLGEWERVRDRMPLVRRTDVYPEL
ncbi:hypothetical protein RB597_005763 [Gaeumannomyces tritici]